MREGSRSRGGQHAASRNGGIVGQRSAEQLSSGWRGCLDRDTGQGRDNLARMSPSRSIRRV